MIHRAWDLTDDDFYPRSPCGERRYHISAPCGACWHFYPRSPCGERLYGLGREVQIMIISIHALLAESDFDGVVSGSGDFVFLSTLSLRRATNAGTNSAGFNIISIHALLAESDHVC